MALQSLISTASTNSQTYLQNAFITHVGKFLPGEPVGNDEMEDYLGQVNGQPSRVRRRILKSNGIQQRHYALDRQQKTTFSNAQMAAAAIRDALQDAEISPKEVDLLACGTTWPDLLVPGFASMVHGELPEFPALEATSHQGVCCAGVAALKYATSQIQLGQKRRAIAVASELASRLFKNTRFEAEASVQAGEKLSFDTEFLRWMLSDGAGAFVMSDRPTATGLSLKVDWIELFSHANAYPTCMYAGVASPEQTMSWMDYPSQIAATQAGVMDLRQNIRLLESVVELGVEGWVRLIDAGRIRLDELDWMLCHYSSHFFRSQIFELLDKAGCAVPEEKWFTNLYTRGNTGCASIYLMLEELFHSGKLQPGQKVFCFVPESGRFTTAYLMLTVVDGADMANKVNETAVASVAAPRSVAAAMAATAPATAPARGIPLADTMAETAADDTVSAELLRQLMLVWLDFQRQLRSVPIVQRLHRGDFTLDDYKALLRNLRPQVVDGARWLTRAASSTTDFSLRSHLISHAREEHRDFQMLERDYVSVGGRLEDIVNAEQNIGSEALSSYIFQRASRENPVDLLGSIFIIEGLGNQVAGQWAEAIQKLLSLEKTQVSFLGYHGENDESHIAKLESLLSADWITAEVADRIVKTAKVTARLYRLQLEEIEL
ncbi:MAG: StlD/DarB family beta-ketosynthase [Cyanobacteria bacterium J06641_5]